MLVYVLRKVKNQNIFQGRVAVYPAVELRCA
jgi:hypothetical protein